MFAQEQRWVAKRALFGLCVRCAGARTEEGESGSFLAYHGLL